MENKLHRAVCLWSRIILMNACLPAQAGNYCGFVTISFMQTIVFLPFISYNLASNKQQMPLFSQVLHNARES